MRTINTVKTWPDHDAVSVKIDTKTYYVCSVCGRLSHYKIKAYGKVYCSKHYRQIKKGKITDNNPRTAHDRNECHIEGKITYIDLYNKDMDIVGQAKIDTEDLNRVSYIKWKKSANGYAMNTPKYKDSDIHMSRVILDTDQMVDHINHDTLDNRKCNLRIVNKSQNQMNSPRTGVTSLDNGKFYAHIKLNGRMTNLGVYVFQDEAFYARWYAETILFGEYRYPKEEPTIPEDRKVSIRDYVGRKVQRL